MVTERIEAPAARTSSFGPRLLGTIGMVCAPMLLLAGLLYPLGGAAAPVASALGMLYLAGWAASAAGMRQLRVAGRPSGAVFVAQLTGLSLALTFNVLEMARANPESLLFRVTDLAWPASHVFMLVVGALVLAARVWRGWRKWTPLLCGLTLPALFAARPLLGGEVGGFVFGAATAVTFMLLGYAVRTSAPQN